MTCWLPPPFPLLFEKQQYSRYRTESFRYAEIILQEKFKSNVMYGEMSIIPLEQLTTIVERVRR